MFCLVNDADHLGIVEGLNYVLLNNPESKSPFEVTNEGALRVKSNVVFDREFQDEYIITIAAGTRKENTTYCVKVKIEDQNDNAPNFTQSVYEANVLDSVPIGTSVVAVYATDDDEGNTILFTKFKI